MVQSGAMLRYASFFKQLNVSHANTVHAIIMCICIAVHMYITAQYMCILNSSLINLFVTTLEA